VKRESKTSRPNGRIRPRQILGISLPPDLASEVKVEAARRGIRLRALFTEMWGLYKAKTSK